MQRLKIGSYNITYDVDDYSKLNPGVMQNLTPFSFGFS
jgi:hypothetical protein